MCVNPNNLPFYTSVMKVVCMCVCVCVCYYRLHPKDGEGNVFSLSTPGGWGSLSWGGGGHSPGGGGHLARGWGSLSRGGSLSLGGGYPVRTTE